MVSNGSSRPHAADYIGMRERSSLPQSNGLVPQSHNSIRDFLMQAYESVLIPGEAIYCSAPITSGRRYLEWLTTRSERLAIDHLTEQERLSHKRDVIEPNQAHAR